MDADYIKQQIVDINRVMLVGMKAGQEIERQITRQLERDCLTLALRLYGEDQSTFAPETAEVMARWRPRVEALLEVTP